MFLGNVWLFLFGGEYMIVNGRKMEIVGKSTLELLEFLDIDSSKVVVEVDGKIINKEDYGNLLKDSCQLEIVSLVGGG